MQHVHFINKCKCNARAVLNTRRLKEALIFELSVTKELVNAFNGQFCEMTIFMPCLVSSELLFPADVQFCESHGSVCDLVLKWPLYTVKQDTLKTQILRFCMFKFDKL